MHNRKTPFYHKRTGIAALSVSAYALLCLLCYALIVGQYNVNDTECWSRNLTPNGPAIADAADRSGLIAVSVFPVVNVITALCLNPFVFPMSLHPHSPCDDLPSGMLPHRVFRYSAQ